MRLPSSSGQLEDNDKRLAPLFYGGTDPAVCMVQAPEGSFVGPPTLPTASWVTLREHVEETVHTN